MTRLLRSMLVLLTFTLTAAGQEVPDRLCVRNDRLNLEIDTRQLTYRAQIGSETFTGPFQLVFWQPDLFYIAGTGSQPGFTFYSNISFLRHSSFADVKVGGQNFRAWNVDHLDCDGNPTTAPPYAVKIEGQLRGVAPFRADLKVIPTDFETLSNYEWCVNDKMQGVGQGFSPVFDIPGVYTIEAEAIYNDIKASVEVEIVVEAAPVEPVVPPLSINHPPTLIASYSGKLKKNKPITLTATASDPDGDALQSTWTCSDGFAASGFAITRTFKPGQYSCRATVQDGRGGSASSSVEFVIKKRN